MWYGTYFIWTAVEWGTPMSRDFAALIREIEDESRRAGSKATAEYAAFGAYYRLALQVLELRKAAGLTQRQLAAVSGVQQGDISRIESGNANPTLATIAALAYALGAELTLGRATTASHERRRQASARRSSGKRSGLAVAARQLTARRPGRRRT